MAFSARLGTTGTSARKSSSRTTCSAGMSKGSQALQMCRMPVRSEAASRCEGRANGAFSVACQP